jgi:hypothetical protein
MDQAALLGELRALADHTPDFNSFTPTLRTHHEWLGKLHALVNQWNRLEAISISGQVSYLSMPGIVRDTALSIILGGLHRVIADLETKVSPSANKAFGPGAVYDFYKSLRELLASAKQSLLIVDPYLDENIFDTYLASVAAGISIRLLCGKSTAGLKPAILKFSTQTKLNVEARSSSAIHDRVVFIDGRSCWVIGQSIKDAAKSKPTYIAPLDAPTTDLKQSEYEKIWNSAKPV